MAVKAQGDPVLQRFRKALADIYGNRLERVVLFGSRARGNAQANSDYDLAIFLKSLSDSGRWEELDRLAKLRVDFLDETGAFFDAKPYPAAAYFDHSPLMHEIRLEGVDV